MEEASPPPPPETQLPDRGTLFFFLLFQPLGASSVRPTHFFATYIGRSMDARECTTKVREMKYRHKRVWRVQFEEIGGVISGHVITFSRSCKAFFAQEQYCSPAPEVYTE